MSKLLKLMKSPSLFLRDYFLKRKPLILSEFPCPLEQENVIIQNEMLLYQDMSHEEKIDVVITWVDSTDPEWKRKFEMEKNAFDFSKVYKSSYNMARFDNHGELFISVKSILNFLPWVNKIYIVTDNQWSEDIQNLSDDIIYIDHKDIIPMQYLPTFNSHVIEAFLHKIPGLEENFIYFNDDVFVGRKLPENHFFETNGLASLFLSQKNISDMRDRGVMTPSLEACINSSELIFKKYKKMAMRTLVHTYVPLKKSIYDFVWLSFQDEIELFVKNKFRSNSDLNLATFLVPWIMFFEEKSFLKIDICHYFNARSVRKNIYMDIASLRKSSEKDVSYMPHSFCINDVFKLDDESDEKYKKDLMLWDHVFFNNKI